jgi:transposase
VLGLAAEVAELRAQQVQPPKTTGNSSVPPSVGFKASRVDRARKRRRGHDGISRRRQAPDLIVRCRPRACRGCGEPLPVAGQRRVGRSQVVELPPVRPVVVEAWLYAARCGGCGVRTKGAYPAGLEPTRTLGPQIEALLGYFHERHHVSYERLVEVCRDLFGLQISEGGIDNALRRLAERARSTYETLGAVVRAGDRLRRDRSASRRQDGLALGVPDARGQLSRPSCRVGTPSWSRRSWTRLGPRAGFRTCGARSSGSTPRPSGRSLARHPFTPPA